MAGANATQFAYRAEALAFIDLARRSDLVVQREVIYQDTRLDFLVSIGSDAEPTDKRFAIEVKARLSQDLGIQRVDGLLVSSLVFAERAVLALQDFDIPACLFVFLIDTDEGFYTWIREPMVTSAGERYLRFVLESGPLETTIPKNGGSPSGGEGNSDVAQHKIRQLKVPFQVLDRAGLETIVDQVNRWYDARP